MHCKRSPAGKHVLKLINFSEFHMGDAISDALQTIPCWETRFEIDQLFGIPDDADAAESIGTIGQHWIITGHKFLNILIRRL
jgi:hypothetical protein